MIELSLNDVASYTGGKLNGSDIKLTGVAIDSRKISCGDLFVAVRGENFDGHDFIKDAKNKGATAFLVEDDMELSLPSVRVSDTRKSLGSIAKGLREKFSGFVIGITGSNGKTTVKELVSSILRKKFKVLSTYGNLNNDIGVPLTIFGLLHDNYDVLVIEMGSNHMGEIKYLTQIVQPDIATITNIGRAHLEGFNDIEGVLQEKSAIFERLKESKKGLGYAIFNRDADEYSFLKQLPKQKEITFGAGKESDVRLESGLKRIDDLERQHWQALSLNIKEKSLALKTPLLGRHNILNIQASIATVLPLDIKFDDIQSAVEEFLGVEGRLQILPGMNGCTVIDDTYNANIDSLKSAIDVLCSSEERKILVLGGMQELGTSSELLHIKAGRYAKNTGVDLLIGCGVEAEPACLEFGSNGVYFSTVDEVIEAFACDQFNIKNASILVKGSRSLAMERVVQALQGRSTCCLH